MKCVIIVCLVFCVLRSFGQRYDVVINEVLFNPVRDGYDFVELYNRGDSIIDLSGLAIANRNATGDPGSIKSLARGPILLNPKQFCLISSNIRWVDQRYGLGTDAVVCELGSMPSFPDDAGEVVIFRASDSMVVDELRYNEDWHFEVIADREGMSLERINYDMATQDRNNWASAAASVGFATPGQVNSQHRDDDSTAGGISVLPKVFSPDNDGVDDYALISYRAGEPGAIANGTIYDLGGRRIRYLIRNAVMGSSGQFKWDGLDDRGLRAGSGMYILVLETYDQRGGKHRYKEGIVVD